MQEPINQKTVSDRAFDAWQRANEVQFDLLMAYKYGGRDSLDRARATLQRALSALEVKENNDA